MLRSIQYKALPILYLWVVGIISVNIHIQMLSHGVPYPGDYFIPPKFYQFSLQLVQLCGMYYLYKQITERYSYFTKIKHILIFL